MNTPTDLTEQLLEAGKRGVGTSTQRAHLRVFKVADPVTVFIRGSRCQVKVRYHDLDQVEIYARLYNAFGVQFATEQDDAGVYIVVKRRRLLGAISRADFLVMVPRYAHLAVNLTPGTVRVEEVDGILEILPRKEAAPALLTQIKEPSLKLEKAQQKELPDGITRNHKAG